MPPRGRPGGTGASFQSLPVVIFNFCLWPFLSSKDIKNVRILSKDMRDRADACITSQEIRIPAGPSHLPSLQNQLTKFSQIETLTLYCGCPMLTCANDATGNDMVRLFRAYSPSSVNIRKLCIVGLEVLVGMALHSLPLSLRQTLVTLDLNSLDGLYGPIFLSLADCPNLASLKMEGCYIRCTEAMDSLACLKQLRSLVIEDTALNVSVPILPLLSMPGLTKLEILNSLGAQDGNFCWSSALDSDAEALAGLSNLTRLELGGDIELTRQHHLPVLKHISTRIEDSGVPLEQLYRLIGGSSSLRKICHVCKGDMRGVRYNDVLLLNITAIPSSGHGISTALQSVSLALQQCGLKQLRLDNRGYGAGGSQRRRLDPQVGDALAPLAATLEHLYLAAFIVDKEAVQSIAQHLLHLSTLCVSSCKMVAGSRAALDQAGIALELTGDDNEGGERVVEEGWRDAEGILSALALPPLSLTADKAALNQAGIALEL
eukprot:gene8484-4844_t